MNKKQILIVGAVIVILIAVVTIGISVFVKLSKDKVSITDEEFKKIMEEKQYHVIDSTQQFRDFPDVKQAYVAASDDYSYQIEFYTLSDNINDDVYAIRFYNNNKEIFQSEKGQDAIETLSELKNYCKYTLSTNGKYKVVSRINNTVIYLDVDEQYKDTVKDELNELGY